MRANWAVPMTVPAGWGAIGTTAIESKDNCASKAQQVYPCILHAWILHGACEKSASSSWVAGRVLARIAEAFTLQLAPTGVHIVFRRTLVLWSTPLPRPWIQGTERFSGAKGAMEMTVKMIQGACRAARLARGRIISTVSRGVAARLRQRTASTANNATRTPANRGWHDLRDCRNSCWGCFFRAAIGTHCLHQPEIARSIISGGVEGSVLHAEFVA